MVIVEDKSTRATLMEGSENAWPVIASEPLTEESNHFRVRADTVSSDCTLGVGMFRNFLVLRFERYLPRSQF